MLPKFIRHIFYKLHDTQAGPARWLADGACRIFYHVVRLFKIEPPYDRAPLTIISHKYRFMFIGIPKVASRAFRDYFSAQERRNYMIEIYESRREFERSLARYPAYFKFSITRNSYARVLSFYNSKVGPKTLSLLKRARILSFYPGLKAGMDFGDFVKWLDSDQALDARADRHFLSQHQFLYEGDQALCDFTGQYETLAEDLETIAQKLAMPAIKLPQAGWVSGSDDYKNSYDKEAQNIIKKRYAQDLKLFGYKF